MKFSKLLKGFLVLFIVIVGFSCFSIVSPKASSDTSKEPRIYKELYTDNWANDINVVWNTGACTNISEGYNGTTGWMLDATKTDNTEWYCEFSEPIDVKHGDGSIENFKTVASIEFDVYLTTLPASFYNFYLLDYREDIDWSNKPVNMRYNRSVVQMDKFIDSSKLKQWQHVSIPISSFSSSGTRVAPSGMSKEDAKVDLTTIIGFGMAHMVSDRTNLEVPTFIYDNFNISVYKLPDPYLDVNMVRPYEFASMVENGTITFDPIDISSVATTSFHGGKGKGWSDQGADNELTGFDLYGYQEFNNIPFNIINPEENNFKSVIGLRSSNASDSKLFTESVEIDINDVVDGFYMIHNMSWSDKTIAKYTYIYDDGTTEAIDIINGQHILNWWLAEETDVNQIIWRGSNVEASKMGIGIKLNMFAFTNPFPTKKVAKLRCEIVSQTAACMISAITAAHCGGNGIYMPYIETIYNQSTENWYQYDLIDWDKIIGSALDASYMLDRNIDRNGFISQKGSEFVNTNGEIVRFWGINVSGQALFRPHNEIDRLVNALAASGYNIVRLMDIDAGFYFPNIFGNSGGTTIDPTSFDQLQYFWAKCKEKGIYIDFCFIGGRYGNTFAGLSKDETSDLSSGAKFEVYIDERLQNQTKEYLTQIFTTVNPYTNTTLAEDPVLALVEIANESNLTNMYGYYTSNYEYEFVSTEYKAMFTNLFNNYLKEKYGSTTELRKAWADSDGEKIGLLPREKVEEGSVQINQSYLQNGYTNNRMADTFRFLYEIQCKFYDDIYNWAKDSNGLGLKSLIAGTTNLPTNDKNDLYINARYDYIARHYYSSHPTTGTEFGVGTATGGVSSLVSGMDTNAFARASSSVLYNIPFIVNESNTAEPSIYTSEFNILTSAIYSLQGWSNISFTFSISGLNEADRDNMIVNAFEFMDHPGRMGTLTSSSILYLSQAISKNKATYLNGMTIDGAMDPNDQSHSNRGKIFIVSTVGNYFYTENENGEKTYYNLDGSLVTRNDPKLLEAIEHGLVVSEDGSIIWANDESRLLVNTPIVQSSVGFNQNRVVELSDIIIDVDNYYSVITLAALQKDINNQYSECNIQNATRLLLTAAGQCRNTDYILSADGTTIKDLGEGPILVEQITGNIILKITDDIKVYALNSSGERIKEIKVSQTKEGYRSFNLSIGDNAMNYEIIRTNPTERSHDSKYWDVENDMASKVEEISKILPTITDQLYMLGENVSRGDFMAALVRALELTTDNERAYADANRYFQGYDELKIARGLALLDGTQIRANDSMSAIDSYLACYRALKHLSLIAEGDVNSLSAELKATLTEEQLQAVAALHKANLITDEDLQSLTSDKYLTRKEAVNLLSSAIECKENGVIVNPEPTPTPNPQPSEAGCNGGCQNAASQIYSMIALCCCVIMVVRKKL